MDFEPRVYPKVVGYLKSLPSGLQSYPDCKVRIAVFEDFKKDFPELGKQGQLPEIVRAVLDGTCRDEWIPEVVGNAMFMMLRDTVLDSDERFMDWHRSNMQRLYSKPLNRALMLIFSPTLLVMGATRKWSHFHLGSELVAEPVCEDNGCMKGMARFTHPENAFNDILLRRLTISFEVALAGSRAQDPRVEWNKVGPTESQYLVSWKK